MTKRPCMKMNFRLARLGGGFLLASCVAAALAALPQVSLAQGAHLLAGQWTFDQDQSDDASQKIHNAEAGSDRRSRGDSGGRYPGGGGGYPGGGGGYPAGGIGFPGGRIGFPGGGGGMGRGRRGPMGRSQQPPSQDLERLAENPKSLTIAQEGNQVTVTDDNSQTLTLAGDGKKHKEKDSGGEKFTIKSHWDGNRLISERKLPRLGKLTETYELSPDQKELVIVSRLDDSQLSGPLVIRRVFDRAATAKSN